MSIYKKQTKLIPCIMGPTATGKTDLAVRLSTHSNYQLMSVDSALIYKGLDIGSAKPDPSMLKMYPHALIDICEPTETYSVAMFYAAAQDFMKNNTKPLLVGGTMMYFNALFNGLAEIPVISPETKALFLKHLQTDGPDGLYKRLSQLDPDAAQRIHPNDPQRIQRALEVYWETGITLSDWWKKQKKTALNYRYIKIALAPKNKQILHQRIQQRLDNMLANGFLEEVKTLLARYPSLTPEKHPALRAVGYRQAYAYLQGEYTLDKMYEQMLRATQQLAKRQLTWLRKFSDLICLDCDDPQLFEKSLKQL